MSIDNLVAANLEKARQIEREANQLKLETFELADRAKLRVLKTQELNEKIDRLFK